MANNKNRFEGAYIIERAISQIVNLSAGALVLSATLIQVFGKDLTERWAIFASWALFILVIISGLFSNYYFGLQINKILTFEGLRDSMIKHPISHEEHDKLYRETLGPEIDKYATKSYRFAVVSRFGFVLALILLAYFAVANVC